MFLVYYLALQLELTSVAGFKFKILTSYNDTFDMFAPALKKGKENSNDTK